MSNGPRNIALPVILALGIAVVALALLPLGDQDPPVDGAAASPAEDAGAQSGRVAASDLPATPSPAAPAAEAAEAATGPVEDASRSGPTGEPLTPAPPPPDHAPPGRAAAPPSSGRNVIAGGAGGSRREVAPVSGGSTAAGAAPRRNAGSSPDGAGSATDSLTVFIEQPPAPGSARQSVPAGPAAAGSAPPDPQPTAADEAFDAAAETAAAAAPGTQPARDVERVEPEPTSPPVVRMLASSAEVRVGDPVAIQVRIAAGTDVGHVPFHVTFDPRLLRFEYGEEGFYLGQDGNQTAFFAAPTSDGAAVVVGLSRLGRVGGVGGDGELCVLHFTATGPGTAALAFARAKVRDSANRIVPSVFESVSITVRE